MLFAIEDAQLEALREFCSGAPLLHLRGIARLLQAHADGWHLCVFSPDIASVIEQCNRFSEEQRNAATKIRNKYSELTALKAQLSTYANVELGDGEASLLGSTWHVPVLWIARNGLHTTSLIGEDLYDCEMAKEAAADHMRLERLYSVSMVLDPINGGGSNTWRTLHQRAVVDKRVCLCLVDSDKRCPGPNAQLGDTAALCLAVTEPGLYAVILTPGREFENHLPIRLTDAVRAKWGADAPTTTYSQLQASAPHVVFYCDMKAGTARFHSDRYPAAEKQFWAAAASAVHVGKIACCVADCSASSADRCHRQVTNPLGRTLLKNALDQLKLWDLAEENRHLRYLPSPNDAHWRALGRDVFAYGIAARVPRI